MFNIDEVFALAEQIEQNGARFYRKAAGQVSDEKARHLFAHLVEMENEHERTFAGMRKSLGGGGTSAAFDPEGQAERYLQALVSGQVFDTRSDPTTRLKGKESVEAILRMAIQLELDSIAYYAGIREAVPAGLGKPTVDAIVREEMEHVSMLSAELALLGA